MLMERTQPRMEGASRALRAVQSPTAAMRKLVGLGGASSTRWPNTSPSVPLMRRVCHLSARRTRMQVPRSGPSPCSALTERESRGPAPTGSTAPLASRVIRRQSRQPLSSPTDASVWPATDLQQHNLVAESSPHSRVAGDAVFPIQEAKYPRRLSQDILRQCEADRRLRGSRLICSVPQLWQAPR
jgi:hypothetical protein